MIKKMTDIIENICIETKKHKPLVHCITNPISIHDCANMILAAGARPIMAEHPLEVTEITKVSKALLLNLGNITDVRMESMKKSFQEAQKEKIPVVLDLVGIACSTLRMDYVNELLNEGYPEILKGNMSEMMKMAGLPSHSIGVDSGDSLTKENQNKIMETLCRLSERTGSVLIVTGKQDLIVFKHEVYVGSNGTEWLSSITGTGCMLGALCGAYLSGGSPLMAALTAVSVMGIAGELASNDCKGPGSFQNELLDAVYGLNKEQIYERLKLEKIEA